VAAVLAALMRWLQNMNNSYSVFGAAVLLLLVLMDHTKQEKPKRSGVAPAMVPTATASIRNGPASPVSMHRISYGSSRHSRTANAPIF
jgi:hypothetical protein